RSVTTSGTTTARLGRSLDSESEIAGIVINGHRTGVKTEEGFIAEIEGYAKDADIPLLGRPLPMWSFIQRANAAGYGFDELSEIRAVEVARFFDELHATATGRD